MLKEVTAWQSITKPTKRLNPYFNGTCSKRKWKLQVKRLTPSVLILILMEHAQRA